MCSMSIPDYLIEAIHRHFYNGDVNLADELVERHLANSQNPDQLQKWYKREKTSMAEIVGKRQQEEEQQREFERAEWEKIEKERRIERERIEKENALRAEQEKIAQEIARRQEIESTRARERQLAIERAENERVLRLEKEIRAEQNRNEILRLIKQREIKWLIHFTKLSNLQQILKYGVSPRNYLESNRIRYSRNDKERLDGNLGFTSVSVSFPNWKLFYTNRMNNNDKYVVLLIDPNMLIEKSQDDLIFHSYNAASKKPPCGFTGMFANSVEGKDEMITRKDNTERNWTTSSQAEIQVRDRISPKHIKKVVFEEASSFLSGAYSQEFIVDKRYFSRRGDGQ